MMMMMMMMMMMTMLMMMKKNNMILMTMMMIMMIWYSGSWWPRGEGGAGFTLFSHPTRTSDKRSAWSPESFRGCNHLGSVNEATSKSNKNSDFKVFFPIFSDIPLQICFCMVHILTCSVLEFVWMSRIERGNKNIWTPVKGRFIPILYNKSRSKANRSAMMHDTKMTINIWNLTRLIQH